jgi:hypothetical protein
MVEKYRSIRIGLVVFLLLAVFVIKPPSKDSLEESSATVLSAQQLIGRFDIQYSLANGQIIKENIKTSQLIEGDTNRASLLQLQGTNEKLTVLHKNGKIWQIQKQNGEFILKFSKIQKRRYVFLSALAGFLFLIGFFLPNLIKK